MSARNTSPSFGHALGAAFVLSIGGTAVLAALGPFVGAGTALRAVIALLGLAYVLYLMGRSGERVGGVTTVALWCFFLIQAFHVLIPAAMNERKTVSGAATDDAFARAHRAAESAVRRLSSIH